MVIPGRIGGPFRMPPYSRLTLQNCTTSNYLIQSCHPYYLRNSSENSQTLILHEIVCVTLNEVIGCSIADISIPYKFLALPKKQKIMDPLIHSFVPHLSIVIPPFENKTQFPKAKILGTPLNAEQPCLMHVSSSEYFVF